MTGQPDTTLEEAWLLLRMARQACTRLGLAGRGGDLSLAHEVRMFAQEFGADGRAAASQAALKRMHRARP